MTATPSYVWLGTLPHPRYRLRKAARLRVTQCEEHTVMVECWVFNTWAIGSHLTDAIERFQAAVCYLYDTIREHDGRLGEHMQHIKAAFDRLIEVRP